MKKKEETGKRESETKRQIYGHREKRKRTGGEIDRWNKEEK